MTRRALTLTGGCYAVGLLLLVLTPISWALNRLTVWMSAEWTYGLHLPGGALPEDFGNALNVLLFVPLGALGVLLARSSWQRATVVAVLLSAAIELVQVLPELHRSPSLTDVVTNGVGALVGALLASRYPGRRSPSPRAGTDRRRRRHDRRLTTVIGSS